MKNKPSKTHLKLINEWKDLRQDIGHAIKAKRLFNGMSYDQMARYTAIDIVDLKAYEEAQKEIPLEHLYRIAMALGVNMYALIPESFF